jgi:hypothetical protein
MGSLPRHHCRECKRWNLITGRPFLAVLVPGYKVASAACERTFFLSSAQLSNENSLASASVTNGCQSVTGHDNSTQFSLPLSQRSFLSFSTMPPKYQQKTQAKKRGRQGEGGGRPRKQARTGRTITQQLLDSVLHSTPWDDESGGPPTSMTKEEEMLTRDMKKDILEMAEDADEQNGSIGMFYPFLCHAQTTAHLLHETSTAPCPR